MIYALFALSVFIFDVAYMPATKVKSEVNMFLPSEYSDEIFWVGMKVTNVSDDTLYILRHEISPACINSKIDTTFDMTILVDKRFDSLLSEMPQFIAHSYKFDRGTIRQEKRQRRYYQNFEHKNDKVPQVFNHDNWPFYVVLPGKTIVYYEQSSFIPSNLINARKIYEREKDLKVEGLVITIYHTNKPDDELNKEDVLYKSGKIMEFLKAL